MATATDIWKLAIEGQLLSTEDAAELAKRFAADGHDVRNAPAKTLTDWFVSQKKISPYQASVLLAGYPGPFVYGPYVIYDRIESGRMAGIFRALHTGTRHRVCLHFLAGEAAQDADVRRRLLEKSIATNQATVGHPHLTRCYHFVDEGAFRFIVLEDVQGRRLERRIAAEGPISVAEACKIARQAALALARLHAMGQAHGEIRPGNVWMEPNDNVKLLMFPLARDPLAPEDAIFVSKEKKGRVPTEADYLAPERTGGAPADPISDIYSLGCVLYHMLAKEAPFKGGDLNEKLRRHREEEPRPLHQVNPKVPEALAKIVAYMMAKDPEMRYQNANSVVEALLPHLTPEDAKSRPQPPSKVAQAYENWLRAEITSQEAAERSAAAAPAKSALPAAAPKTAPVAAVAPAPTAAQPAVAQPAVAQPAVAQPAVAQPAMAQPAVAQPMTAQSAMATPVATQPMMAQPAVAVMAGGFAQPAPAFADPLASAASAPSGPSLAARSRARARRQRNRMLMMVLLLAAFGGGGYALWINKDAILGPEPQAATAPTSATTTASPPAGAGAVAMNPMGEVAPVNPMPGTTAAATGADAPPKPDEPKAPEVWSVGADKMLASPTHGKPLDLKYLPPGAKLIVALRPADLMAYPEASRLLDERVLGSLGPWVQNQLPEMIGVKLEDIQQAIIGVIDFGEGEPTIAVVAHLAEAPPESTLLASWGDPKPVDVGGKKVYVGPVSRLVPDGGEGKVIVAGPQAAIEEVAKAGGAVFLLPAVEALQRASDADRDFTLLAEGAYLTVSKPLSTGPAERLRDAAKWLLVGDDAQLAQKAEAVLFSFHLAPKEDFKDAKQETDLAFAELRVYDSTASKDQLEPAEQLQSRLKEMPRKGNTYVIGLDVTPYSAGVLGGLRDMLDAVRDNSRVGVSEKQVVARLYLPDRAAHNLALAAYLCALENPKTAGAMIATATAGGLGGTAVNTSPVTAQEKIKKKMSLSFPRNTLEMSMQMLGDELGVPFTIMGGDLQLDGITKNQSFGLEENDKPGDEILRVILKKANPDGKLVYVIKKGDSGNDEVFITTRAAVEKRGDKLPPELEMK